MKWPRARGLAALVAAALTLRPGSPAAAPREPAWTGSLSWPTGAAFLRRSDWTPAHEQWEFGVVDADFRRTHWPVSVVTGLWLTYHGGLPRAFRDHAELFAPGSTRGCGTYEVDLGLRREWGAGRRRFQVCGGPAVVGGAVQSFLHRSRSPNEYEGHAALGAFAGAGLRSLHGRWFWGVQAREVFGRVRIFDRRMDVGGTRVALELGMRRGR